MSSSSHPLPVRNPAPVLTALAEAAKRCPDLRIGQLICAALSTGHGPDLFYIEDEVLARLLGNVTGETRRR